MPAPTTPPPEIAGSASPAQAAAVAAAIESFTRDTASPRPGAEQAGSGSYDAWTRAAMLEGVARGGRGAQADVPDPWINT